MLTEINSDLLTLIFSYINPYHTLYLNKALQKYFDANEVLWKMYFKIYFPNVTANIINKKHFIQNSQNIIKQLRIRIRHMMIFSSWTDALSERILPFPLSLKNYFDAAVPEKLSIFNKLVESPYTKGCRQIRTAITFSYSTHLKTSSLKKIKITLQLLSCRNEKEKAHKLFNQYAEILINEYDISLISILSRQDHRLILASTYGLVNEIEIILCDPTIPTIVKNKAFVASAECEHMEAVEKIWELSGINNISNNAKAFAFIHMVQCGSYEFKKLWKTRKYYNIFDECKGPAFVEAAKRGNSVLIEQIWELSEHNISKKYIQHGFSQARELGNSSAANTILELTKINIAIALAGQAPHQSCLTM